MLLHVQSVILTEVQLIVIVIVDLKNKLKFVY